MPAATTDGIRQAGDRRLEALSAAGRETKVNFCRKT